MCEPAVCVDTKPAKAHDCMQSDFYTLDIDNEALVETVLHAQIASVVRPGQIPFCQLSHCPSSCRLQRLTCSLPCSPPLPSGVTGGNWRPSQVQTSSSWNRSCMSCQHDQSKPIGDRPQADVYNNA